MTFNISNSYNLFMKSYVLKILVQVTAWKAVKLTMDKASVTRTIEKQIHYITIHGPGNEKQNAIHFQKQFEV
ncbi:4050_t:CDS:2 [Entrophospora sp. SA101]|nr:4050_t:CDS:2 [Entrophospora sp. SA101]